MRRTPVLVAGAFLAGLGVGVLVASPRASERPVAPGPAPADRAEAPRPAPPDGDADPSERLRGRYREAGLRKPRIEDADGHPASAVPHGSPIDDARMDVARGTWMFLATGPSPKETVDPDTGLPVVWVGAFGTGGVDVGYADVYNAEVRRLWRATPPEKRPARH